MCEGRPPPAARDALLMLPGALSYLNRCDAPGPRCWPGWPWR